MPKSRPKSVTGPPKSWVSPSELREWRTCPRKWAWRRVHGVFDQDDSRSLLGKEVHRLEADYLGGGELPDLDLRRSWSWTGDAEVYYPGRILHAVLPLLPDPKTGRVEEADFFTIGKAPVKVIPDWTGPGRIVDLKTTTNVSNRISRPRLRKDPAALLYAIHNSRIFGALEVEARWIYVRRTDPYDTKPVEVRWTQEELEEAAAELEPELLHLLELKASEPEIAELPMVLPACFRCSYRRGCAQANDVEGQHQAPSAAPSSLGAIVSSMNAAGELEGAPSLSELMGDLQEATFEVKATGKKGDRNKKSALRKWKIPPRAKHFTDLYTTHEGVLADSMKLCQETLGEIRRGEIVHVVTMGHWAMEQPIVHLAELSGGPCDLYMATWAVAMVSALRLAEAIRRGWLRELRIVMDERIKVHRPEVLDVLQIAAGTGSLGLCPCHSKLYVLRSVDPEGPAYTFVGSANLTQNPRPEALVIQESREVADFHVEWISEMLDEGRAYPYRSTYGDARELALQALRLDREEDFGVQATHDEEEARPKAKGRAGGAKGRRRGPSR